jgi:hypothetical protein
VAIVTTQYEMFVPRRRRIGTGSTISVGDPPPPSSASGNVPAFAADTIEVHYPTAGDPLRPASFAFWSVNGSADGDFTQANQALVATTNGQPMNLTAWYVLDAVPGSNGNGRSELETDAFLVSENAFIDPTPIAGVAPGDAWDHSDVSEFVFTDVEASDVTAFDVMAGHAAEHFERWYSIEGGATPSGGHLLHVPIGDDGIAIATYHVPPPGPTPQRPPRPGDEIGGTIVGGVGVDGGGGIIINGHFFPIGPWDPLLAGLAVLQAAKGLEPAAERQVQLQTLHAMGMTIQSMTKQLELGGTAE